MRQLLIIASVVGLFMYAGFALEYDGAPTSAARAGTEPLAGLEQALSATGALLERVTITGWVRVAEAGARDRAAAALGWTGATTPSGEVRELKVHRRDGAEYLSLRWVLSSAAKGQWVAQQGKVRQILAAAGTDPAVTVQLEGSTERSGLISLSAAALDALKATGRQPWGDPSAASIAGQTDLLPASQFGVNIQAAARREPAGNRTRVWVAWPALQQEY